MTRLQRVGFLVGAIAFVSLLVMPAPSGLSASAWRTAAVVVLMAVFWTTEEIPISATALLPLALFPSLGVLQMAEAEAPYANEIVFLSMGGFFIAVAMESTGLHRRIALAIVALVGTAPRRLVLRFMLAAAFLSMWISNPATTAMMYPIAMAIGSLFRPSDRDGRFEFGICLMLGIAYASTIGGITTLIGTPPNAVLAAAASATLGIEIGFVEWMFVGVPIAVVFLPLGWWILTGWLYPPGDLRGDAGEAVARERVGLGPMSRGELVVSIVFVVTALAWILRTPKELGSFTLPGIVTYAPWVKDSTIAMAAAVALFVIPIDWKKGRFARDWTTANRIPWGVLVLFGGGLTMSHAMATTGLAMWFGDGVADLVSLPPWLILGVVAALFVFLTEITSNVATATMAMPIMASAATGLGIPPLQMMATAALAVSMAFMLPVATPPNAIVFASGYLTIPQMVRAGFWFTLVAIPLVTATASWLVPSG